VALERDDDAEREERIRRILARLQAVQESVARLAAEGSERASQTVAERNGAPPASDPKV
jgi:hypothetical protein